MHEGKCQFNEMHKKMQINTLNKRILEIIPKLAGIPLHLQHFLGVAAKGGGVAVSFYRGKALCRKHLIYRSFSLN